MEPKPIGRRGSRRGVSMLLAVLVAAGALALPADAAGPDPAPSENVCALTVLPGGEELAEDLSSAHVVVDVYRLADAEPNGVYDVWDLTMAAPYEELAPETEADPIAWDALAQSAAGLALQGDTPVIAGGKTGESWRTDDGGNALTPGLYLLLARGEDVEDYVSTLSPEPEDGETETGTDGRLVTIARSAVWEYSFAPALVFLPTKEINENGTILTSDPGDWIFDLTVTLKPERERRTGALEIVKTLRSYETSGQATFVFSVNAVLDGETVFSDVFALSFTAAGQKTIRVEDLPVGAEVTVTEIYDGSRYTIASSAAPDAVTITAEEAARVEFTNDYDETSTGGHGAENRFTFTGQDGTDADWSWTPPDNIPAGTRGAA